MSEQLAQATMEQPAPEAAGFMMNRIYEAAREHPLIAKLAVGAGMLGAGGATELAMASPASASETAQPTTITELTGDTVVHIGKSRMSDSAYSAANVMSNARTISRAEINELKEDGDCQVFNGKKVKIYTDGHFEGGVAPGRDTRKSLFCQDDNGEWFRAACGNHAEINITPPHAIENVVWANGKLKFKVVTRASATAVAMCTTSDGLASAYAYGRGRGYAVAKLRGGLSAKAHAKGADSKLINKTSIDAKGRARSKANAEAVAVCIESGGQVIPVIPKDSTQGPGSVNTGQEGGANSGGQTGNPTEGAPCYDDASTTNGDQNPATSGDILYGNPDQVGVCVGPAQPMQNA